MALTRREFVLLGATTGAAVAVGVVVPLSIATRDRFGDDEGGDAGAVVALFPKVRVASLSELSQGSPVLFDYPLQGQGNVLVKTGNDFAIGGIGPDSDIVAFSRVCTHMGCELTEYQAEHNVLGPCACHFTTFDLVHNGQVTLGQATQNLPQVLLAIEEGDVYAVGVIRLVYGFSNNLEGADLVGGTA